MNLQQQLLAYFDQPAIHSRICHYAQTHNLDLRQLSEQSLLDMLEELHLLDDLQQQMQEESQDSGPAGIHTLSLAVNKGRKFRPMLDMGAASFQLQLSAFGQKTKTAAYPAAENFSLSEKLSLSLSSGQLKSDNSDNLELVVVVTDSNDSKIVYAMKLVEWRFALAYGSVSLDLELPAYSHQGVGPLPVAGILSVVLTIAPLPKHFFLSEVSLKRQLDLEQKLKQSANNQFHAYANSYWAEIKDLHRSFQGRRVPIYVQTEDKLYLPLPKLITPLNGIRGIDSPHHALRFVSLIPFSESAMNREKSLKRFSTMLGGRSGSVEDHCHLLCSLLLGMGLKSWVCVGTTSKSEHSWVMTEGSSTITFWEATRGIKLDYFSPRALTFYRTLHAVYNNRQFYASLQLDDSLAGTKFNFNDRNLWKPMEESMLEALPSFNRSLGLSHPSSDPHQQEAAVQAAIIAHVGAYRKKMKLGFSHDPTLAGLLATALANYQVERVTGATFCQQEFQSAIKNYLPLKHSFKAYPTQLTTLDSEQIMTQLQDQKEARDILNVRGESVFFAVRTKLVVFPDGVFALWLSLAVRYFRLD